MGSLTPRLSQGEVQSEKLSIDFMALWNGLGVCVHNKLELRDF